MVKKCLIMVLMLFPMFLMAQNPMFLMAQNEGSKKQTKYEEFVSKTGIILKFVDKSMKKCKIDAFNSFKVTMRTLYRKGNNRYFILLEKNKTLKSAYSSAYIEYSDLVEINKALAKLLNEVNIDCELKPEYLENTFTSVDGFKVGYYFEKSKVTWIVELEFGAESFTISNPIEFANYLLGAQKEIEATIAQNGK